MRDLLGDTNMLAYLAMMTPRLIELHRVLKPTGTLYLHCDPTAAHYLKLILDAVFGPSHYLNEIIWCYRTSAAPRPRTSSANTTRSLHTPRDESGLTNVQRGAIAESTVKRFGPYFNQDGKPERAA